MNDSLLVPIELDVLLANNALVGRDSFRIYQHDYDSLNDFASSEPDLGLSDVTMPAGVYLHWTLPRSLRSGRVGSSTDYPLVPNRWLVTRLYSDAAGTNAQRAWIVESDCPTAANAGNNSQLRASAYLIDDAVLAKWQKSGETNRTSAAKSATSISALDLASLAAGHPPTTSATGSYAVHIGRAFDQATWKEQAAEAMYLTALAPGNLEFSAYMPYNNNVFSFYDDLSDVPTTTTLSYLVTGWYSDSTQDIIATNPVGFTGGTSSAEILAALDWTVADGATPGALAASLYTGMAFSLSWDNSSTSSAPVPDQLADAAATANVRLAIANTGVDAFSTLVGQQLASSYPALNTASTIELLRAFHYDLLPLLNQPNGSALLDERVRQEWFRTRAGGTRWTIVAGQPAAADAPAPALSDTEQAWLLQLNQDQQALDEALATLYSLQWDLNAAWWKTGYWNAIPQRMLTDETGTTAEQQAAALTVTATQHEAAAATTPDILMQVLGQLELVNKLLAQVPQPIEAGSTSPQAAFLAGIAQFATTKGLAAGLVLKAVAQPRFWQPTNPTMLVSGVEPSSAADPDTSLVVRLSSQQISANTTSSLLPELNTNNLPAGLAGIYAEFLLLNPTSKLSYTGTLPAGSLAPWSQGWNPLYLEWEVIYTALPFEYKVNGTATGNWSFNGTDYDLKLPLRLPNPPVAETIRGRSVLSAHTQLTFGARLKAFVDQYGTTETDLSTLYTEIGQIDKDWQFLSQELVDFNDWLTQRNPRTYRRPTVETVAYNGADVNIAQLIGYPTSSQPATTYAVPAQAQGRVGSVPAVKIDGPSDFPFQAVRSGQAYFNQVVLYDKFGRMLTLVAPGQSGIKDADSFPLVCDAALAVPAADNQTTAKFPFQLPPRLLQPARLDMLLVAPQDSSQVLGLAAAVNPVCGWVLANHLDQSLLVFGPDGTGLGELRAAPAGATPQVQWAPPPHSQVTSLTDLTALVPQLGAFVAAAATKTSAEFQALLGAIDSTLWTTDPLGSRTDQNLSVLVGRPLALLRVRLQFVLEGPPLAACDWPAQLAGSDPNVPDFTTAQFSIRFGDLAAREDGVIGYFEDQNYDVFNSVAAPPAAQAYVQEIGPLAGAEGNYLRLPFDGHTTKTVSLLVDPRAAIHATTGILPVKTLTIPAQFVDKPLASLELPFRVGPLLARVRPAAAGSGTPAFANALGYLPLSEQKGTWSWWEAELAAAGTTWQGYGLATAATQADFGAGPATLHDGYLQFQTDLDPDK